MNQRYSTAIGQSLASLLALAIAVPSTQAITLPGLYNTGVDDNGVVLPLHSLEQHYWVSGASDTSYLAPIVYHLNGGQAWITPPPGAAWIGPNATDSTWPTDPSGIYHYELTMKLDLTGYDLSKVQIAGQWATDNSSEIWFNGVYTGFNKGEWGFTRLDPFLISGGFVDGVNTLEFRVRNFDYTVYPSGNPTGLLVAGLIAVDDGSLTLPRPPAGVPETGWSIALLGANLLLLALVSWRLRAPNKQLCAALN